MNLTAEQVEALRNGQAVRLALPEIGAEVVVLLPSALTELLDAEREKAAWARVARKAADRWARENPFHRSDVS